jgi:hypothetical protein
MAKVTKENLEELRRAVGDWADKRRKRLKNERQFLESLPEFQGISGAPLVGKRADTAISLEALQEFLS